MVARVTRAGLSALAVETLQSVVEPMLLERLEVSELHTANVASEELVGWESRAVVLFSVFDVGGSVAVALTTLLADEGFLVRPRRVLQGGVALQQPG